MIDENWIYATLLINGIGTGLYVRGVLSGAVRPNRVTWGILSVAPIVAGCAMLAHGVSLAGAFYTFLTGLGPLTICISTFFTRHPVWRIRRFDIACGVLSLVGLLLWLISGDGLIAIVLAMAADGLAFLPTILKAWQYPETERAQPFILSGCGAVLSLMIVSDWTIISIAFPLYILVVDTLTVLGIIRGRMKRTKETV